MTRGNAPTSNRYRAMPSPRYPHLLFAIVLCTLAPRTTWGQAPGDLTRLRWLAGCWELRTATRTTHEQWMAPLGGIMLGMSRTVVRDVAREYETLRIQSGEGGLTYVAQPGGQAPTSFVATSVADTLVVFANPRHDFPQRISYRRRLGSDSLVARIEGERGGALQHITFPMQRVACGDAPPSPGS
jgi:hypothetical protein